MVGDWTSLVIRPTFDVSAGTTTWIWDWPSATKSRRAKAKGKRFVFALQEVAVINEAVWLLSAQVDLVKQLGMWQSIATSKSARQKLSTQVESLNIQQWPPQVENSAIVDILIYYKYNVQLYSDMDIPTQSLMLECCTLWYMNLLIWDAIICDADHGEEGKRLKEHLWAVIQIQTHRRWFDYMPLNIDTEGLKNMITLKSLRCAGTLTFIHKRCRSCNRNLCQPLFMSCEALWVYTANKMWYQITYHILSIHTLNIKCLCHISYTIPF